MVLIKYNSMISFINSNSLSNSKNYEKIKKQIDIQSFSDFWIGEIYTANYDILNTRYFSNPLVTMVIEYLGRQGL